MLPKALDIDEKLGNLEGIASQYGNLAIIYDLRGELDEAEKMHRKALNINEKLGNQVGMADCYSNLGSVAKARGELERARKLWTKALDLYAKIGMPHMVKRVQGWLNGLLPAETKE